jgi:hypothetical protein
MATFHFVAGSEVYRAKFLTSPEPRGFLITLLCLNHSVEKEAV